MPKQRKRKQPIIRNLNAPISSTKAQNCRKVIRQFHVLLKRRTQLQDAKVRGTSSAHAQELAEIEAQIAKLGGLERYQQMSVLGQKEERGGGSEKVFIDWMKELGLHQKHRSTGKLRCVQETFKLQFSFVLRITQTYTLLIFRLLEVGALKADNYRSCATWIDCTPMDLHSRHPQIMERDFLLLDIDEHENKWDAISLSLVVNFVPSPADRGNNAHCHTHEFTLIVSSIIRGNVEDVT